MRRCPLGYLQFFSLYEDDDTSFKNEDAFYERDGVFYEYEDAIFKCVDDSFHYDENVDAYWDYCAITLEFRI